MIAIVVRFGLVGFGLVGFGLVWFGIAVNSQDLGELFILEMSGMANNTTTLEFEGQPIYQTDDCVITNRHSLWL